MQARKERNVVISKIIKFFPALKNAAENGWLLMACAIIAMLSANTDIHKGYIAMVHSKVGDVHFETVINDFLMMIYFTMIGIEVKKEVVEGHLSKPEQMLYPVVAALFGILVPSLIYVFFNYGNKSVSGWAVPTATDIAFTLGIISMLKKYIPKSLKVLVTAIAVVDDIIAVLIITIFYTGELSSMHLLLALALSATLFLLNKKGIVSPAPYLIVGGLLWFSILKSGVHATVAGVIIGIAAPIQTGHKIEKVISPICVYMILPLFALFNSGIRFIEMDPSHIIQSKIFLGITFGLLIGKPLGIYSSIIALSKLLPKSLPEDITKFKLFVVSSLCGIGFTMSIFVTLLAFESQSQIREAKLGVLTGSALSMLIGVMLSLVHKYMRRR